MTAPEWTDAALTALVAECEEAAANDGVFYADVLRGQHARLLSALRSVLAERALTESEAATMREASTSLNAMLVPRLFAIVTRLTRRTP